jgi:large subunit ribosomal protein L23
MKKVESFWDIIDYPVTTEKVVRLIETENKLVFQLKSLKTNKKEIKGTFEKEFKVKVDKINTLITRKGKKRAILKLKKEFSAGDVAVKLGII